MTEPGGPLADAADIRFDRVEPQEGEAAVAACNTCDQPLAGSYFEVGGQMLCPGCRDVLATQLGRGTPVGRLGRAFGAGFVAAAIGSGIYYAVLALTGYEVGLIAVVVGLLVGGAVRWGSHGRGGWLYQGLAVGLTYVAIVSTYVPFLFEAMAEEGRQGGGGAVAAVATGEATPVDAAGLAGEAAAAAPGPASPGLALAAAGSPPPPEAGGAPAATSVSGAPAAAAPAAERLAAPGADAAVVAPVGLGGLLLAVALFTGLVLALPFLAGFENILGWFIIGFALFEAWKMNRRRQLTITGPFQIAAPAATEPGAPAAAG